ncbi:MAG: DMT family transporter [Candidatus Aenigmarchaeota archaeon]|nr:DMT family transporter [Candidatus Aenigmarchaeota archaeon]
MLGFLLALLSAASKATTDVFSKKGLDKTDEYVVAFALRFFTLPFMALILLSIPIPLLDSTFYAAAFSSAFVNMFSTILYLKAIKESPLSLTIPFLSFAPIFILVIASVFFGEFPGIYGIAGVFLVVIGTYLLNLSKTKEGLLAPFKAILKEKGSRYMLVVAFLYSITTSLDKLAVTHSSPLFYAVVFNSLLSLFMFFAMLKFSKNHLTDLRKHKKVLFPAGFFMALASIAYFMSLSMILVVFVSAIKRTNSLFSIFYGKYFFGEDNIKERLLGAFIMILGVLMITIL